MLVHKGGGGVKKARKLVHMVYEWRLGTLETLSMANVPIYLFIPRKVFCLFHILCQVVYIFEHK